MPGSDETRTITGWRQASRYYRRGPGLGWLLALLAIPASFVVLVVRADPAFNVMFSGSGIL
mgnify:CR=1 FL=1